RYAHGVLRVLQQARGGAHGMGRDGIDDHFGFGVGRLDYIDGFGQPNPGEKGGAFAGAAERRGVVALMTPERHGVPVAVEEPRERHPPTARAGDLYPHAPPTASPMGR